MDRTLSERMWVVRLIEAYGRLLTAHQQRILRLYYFDDLSLGEIAERLHVTRQAVFDGLRRSLRELRRVEASVGLVQVRDGGVRRQQTIAAQLDALERAIGRLNARVDTRMLRRVTTALAAVRRAIRERGGARLGDHHLSARPQGGGRPEQIRGTPRGRGGAILSG